MQQSGATAFAIHAATTASEDDIPHIVVASASTTTTIATPETAVTTIDISAIPTGKFVNFSIGNC